MKLYELSPQAHDLDIVVDQKIAKLILDDVAHGKRRVMSLEEALGLPDEPKEEEPA